MIVFGFVVKRVDFYSNKAFVVKCWLKKGRYRLKKKNVFIFGISFVEKKKKKTLCSGALLAHAEYVLLGSGLWVWDECSYDIMVRDVNITIKKEIWNVQLLLDAVPDYNLRVTTKYQVDTARIQVLDIRSRLSYQYLPYS